MITWSPRTQSWATCEYAMIRQSLPTCRPTARRCAAVQRGAFPDHRAVADHQQRILAVVLQVLRVATEHGAAVHAAPAAEVRVPLDHDVRPDPRARPTRTFGPITAYGPLDAAPSSARRDR
jgi:hypothetical protein